MPRISQKTKHVKRANWIVLTTVVLLVIFVVIFVFWSKSQKQETSTAQQQTQENVSQTTGPNTDVTVRDFYECQDAGFPVQETLPAQCTDAQGTIHIQPSGTYQDYVDDIYIEQPLLGSKISSPVSIEGRARGTWFFEAEFTVILKDATGTQLAQGTARATGNWMTEELVPFGLTLTFDKPSTTDRGELIFQASNPSGVPESAQSMRYPIRFKP